MSKNRGITLIALIITIIVLLILASVSIAMLMGENGILTQSNESKIHTALGSIKEEINLYKTEKIIEGKNVTAETLLSEGKTHRTLQLGNDNRYHMNYILNIEHFSGNQGLGKGNISDLEDVFLIDDNFKVKYIAKNGKEYGDNLNDKILEDETTIRFSNKAFSKYISEISGVEEENMKFKWMKTRTKLSITDPNVDSLQDLVFFPNLLELELGDWNGGIPNITSMDGVENCTKLEKITIIKGPNKDYTKVSNLQSLKYFIRGEGQDYANAVKALKNCSSLLKFSFSGDKIKSMLDIKELKNLQQLTLSNCNISKIEGINTLQNLKSLELPNNNIETIEGMENLIKLERVDLANNKIKDITPLSKNESLKSIKLTGNSEIEADRSKYSGEKLEALKKLERILDNGGDILLGPKQLKLFTNYRTIDLAKQKLTTLEDLEGQTQLIRLNLESNELTLEDSKSQEILKKMKNLEFLNLGSNRITNVSALNELTSLKSLNLIWNTVNLKEMEDIISNLDTLRINDATFKTIANCDANKIKKLALQSCGLTSIEGISKCNQLTRLELIDNPNIVDLSEISQIETLRYLKISKINMHNRMINFSKLTNLTEVYLWETRLWSEDLENLKALKKE